MTDPSNNPIIVALDTGDFTHAETLVSELKDCVGKFKVGLELIAGMLYAGRSLNELNLGLNQLMLDFKLHDIPNTMGAAADVIVQDSSVWGVTVHATAGPKALEKVVRLTQPHFVEAIGVTLLTSHDEEECSAIYNGDVRSTSIRLATLAIKAGVRTIVCSPQDIERIQQAAVLRFDKETTDYIYYVCPGVRPEWAQKNDQARVMTPKEAIQAGADNLVIGRPITKPPNGWTPREAAQRILAELK